MLYLSNLGSVNADLKVSMVFKPHKQADMLKLSVAAREIRAKVFRHLVKLNMRYLEPL
ncbi:MULTISPECIES: hypothetical protein [unclassified Nostoc]|uniref:hypothetical protein n=1 Tax=unclassified Nostoc TaxID=2593658 RepID=UPI0026280ECB|nr:hypothetical protein [Nostoc sp. S13]MDF5734153.1 hypothetical protein [Nostoc sp. S13]